MLDCPGKSFAEVGSYHAHSPRDWYHAAQTIRVKEEYSESVIEDDSEDDNDTGASKASLDESGDGEPRSKHGLKRAQRSASHEAASNELYTHEILALLSCFVFPLVGAYLLHSLRSQLSRPSEGLVSNYNLTIFILASEMRPMGHLVKLIQSRTLHLQRLVNANPYGNINQGSSEMSSLTRRLEELEARVTNTTVSPNGTNGSPQTGKQSALLTSEVRRTLQPDLDALNRAVRRYEKRATLQTMQTEARLRDLEARLGDAISLAAAAAQNSQRQGWGVVGMLVESVGKVVVIPMQVLGTFARLPFRVMVMCVDLGRGAVGGGHFRERGREGNRAARYPSNSRVGGERLPGKGMKR